MLRGHAETPLPAREDARAYLLPVIVALVAVTLLAISRASSAQETSAYAELNQRTAVQSAKVDQSPKEEIAA